MSKDLLVELNRCCSNYFNAAALFLRVTVSVWTLGYIVPVHTKQVFDKYGVSLGINTMQGREAKHQRLAQYAKNTTFKNRWHQIFRHEYMHLIWLRQRNTYRDDYSKTTTNMHLSIVILMTFVIVICQKIVRLHNVTFAQVPLSKM